MCNSTRKQSKHFNMQYKHELNDEGHKKLIDFAISCKSKIMISVYEHEMYDNSGLYKIKLPIHRYVKLDKKNKRICNMRFCI